MAAATAVRIAVLMIVVASVCLDVCKACLVCETPSTPVVYYPPRVYYPPKAPRVYYPPTPRTPRVYYPPKAPEAPPPPTKCPVSLVQLSVCSPLLGTSKSCCALLNLLGVDAEICLCLALDINILGLITVNTKIDVIASIFIDCGYNVPPNLSCPS